MSNVRNVAPMMATVVEGVVDGVSKDEAQAAWKTVADAAEKTKGMTRFKAAWAAEGDKALITEIVAGPEEYLSFIGELDVPYLLKTIKFEKFFIQGTKEQIEKLGDMPKKLGMQVYHTDDVPGYHEDDEETAQTKEAPMVATVVEGIAKGATKEQVEAAWKTVSEAAQKTKGMARFKASWAAEGETGLITEVVDGPKEYLDFISKLDVPSLLSKIEFLEFHIQGTKDQIKGLGEMPEKLGMIVYHTDGVAGYHQGCN